ncbi:hypothetical protein ACJJTC_005213 [Scirpophaga incertulas]
MLISSNEALRVIVIELHVQTGARGGRPRRSIRTHATRSKLYWRRCVRREVVADARGGAFGRTLHDRNYTGGAALDGSSWRTPAAEHSDARYTIEIILAALR